MLFKLIAEARVSICHKHTNQCFYSFVEKYEKNIILQKMKSALSLKTATIDHILRTRAFHKLTLSR